MGDSTKIQWTESTWNPVRGCSVVSPGCENCYAMGVAARFSGEGQPYEGLAKFSPSRRLPQWTGKVRLVPEHLADPLRWTKPRRIFVNSMSDLFHEGLTNEEIAAVFGVMSACPQHTFQILTKRAKRMREWFEWVRATSLNHDSDAIADAFFEWQQRDVLPSAFLQPTWPLPNVWIGVSAEDQTRADERIPDLLRTPAAVRFVSYEPALGPINFQRVGPINALRGRRVDATSGESEACTSLDWIIVGGESGPRARPFDVDWARSVVLQCKSAGVACFVKQLGANPYADPQPTGNFRTHNGKRQFEVKVTPIALKSRKGGDPAEWPADLRVRQFPEAHP